MRLCNMRRAAAMQRGLSLVELMVGVTVGLFVVAAAAMLVANQLVDNRRLLLETQVQQDLRASLDIITRQLRRAGYTGLAEFGLAPNSKANPYPNVSGANFSYFYSVEDDGPFGFKLEDSTVKTLVGGAWQELTDSRTLEITDFSITPRTVSSTALPCPKLCAGGTTSCWPRLEVLDFVVDIEATARSDAQVKRRMRSEVRVRNDLLRFDPGIAQVCPA